MCSSVICRPLTLRRCVINLSAFLKCCCRLTVMEAVSMYHVCSFHKRPPTQLIPFRLGILEDRGERGAEMSFHTALRPLGERKNRNIPPSLKLPVMRKKIESCGPAKATNHQFHTEPITVPKTRLISIRAFLTAFGAFGALKGLRVPSSASSNRPTFTIFLKTTDCLILPSPIPPSGEGVLRQNVQRRNAHLRSVSLTLSDA